jgi:hypothetical protein
MSNVQALKTSKARVDESVVRLLEMALEDAKRGDIKSVAVSVLLAKGGARSMLSQSNNRLAQIGAIVELLMTLILDGRGEQDG